MICCQDVDAFLLDFLRDGDSCTSNPPTYFFSNLVLIRKMSVHFSKNKVVGENSSGKRFVNILFLRTGGLFCFFFFLGKDLPLGSFELLCFLVASSSRFLGDRSKSTSDYFQLPSLKHLRPLRGVQSDSGWSTNICHWTRFISTPNTRNVWCGARDIVSLSNESF